MAGGTKIPGAAGSPGAAGLPGAGGGEPSGGGEDDGAILVVDDRADKLTALESALEGLSERIIRASSGAEALRHLLKKDFAVILLDVNMPQMDGFETAELIRARPRSSSTPIIFVTAVDADGADAVRGYALGAVDYITSPVRRDVLRAKVSVFLDLYRKTVRIRHQQRLLREAAERRASAAEDRLEGLLNRLEVGVFTADREGHLFSANPAFLRLVGAAEIGAVDRALVRTFLGRGRSDVAVERGDGGPPKWLHVTTAEESAGRIEGIVEDVTARKHAETELRLLNDSLEQRVEERGHALRLSEEQRRRSERLAALGTLAAGIAHEINNPLNAILMAGERARRRLEGDEPSSRMLDMVVDESKRCGVIIKQVLQFARNQRTSKEPFDLNTVVASAVDMVRSYSRSPLRVVTDLTPSPLPALLNATEMEQVIINIVQNAVEAGGEKVSVSVQTRAEGEDGVVSLTDDGPGIPEELLGRIFDPFFSTRTTSGGTGLGLSVVHGIVTDHGGTVRAASRPGEGATFTITLPLIGRAAAEAGFTGVA